MSLSQLRVVTCYRPARVHDELAARGLLDCADTAAVSRIEHGAIAEAGIGYALGHIRALGLWPIPRIDGSADTEVSHDGVTVTVRWAA